MDGIFVTHIQTCAAAKNHDPRFAGSEGNIECQDPGSTGPDGKIT